MWSDLINMYYIVLVKIKNKISTQFRIKMYIVLAIQYTALVKPIVKLVLT